MKKAFTLIELIFVIVIIGIMAGVGASSFKPTYLIDDVNYIHAKIKEAQFRGIGYEHNSFGTEMSSADYSNGCVNLSKAELEKPTADTKSIYRLHVEIDISALGSDTLCFDSKGRPHTDNFTKTTLLSEHKVLKYTYRAKDKDIIIEPVSGYAIIKHY